MQPGDGLFPPVGDRNEQWTLECLLLCNWGGFGGVTGLELHPVSTLLSGASGAGKSTILDAYTALVDPGRQFNIASNEAGEKRRTEGTRTTLSYVRGQYDRADRDGDLVPRVLRGAGQDTWSAIAAVFLSTTGARLTPLRLFFAPREATAHSEMTSVYGVFDGRLERRHLESVEPLAPKKFRKDLLEKALPGLQVMNQGQYAELVQTKLHIGPPGDGAKALRLLHELQAGKPQPSVNALFKQMVLEEPVTFAEADAVVASFDTLDEGYRAIRTKQEQADVLAGIEADHDMLTGAQAEIDRIDTLRVTAADRSPFLLWAHRRKAELYDQEIELAGEERQAAEEEQQRLTERAGVLAEELAEIEQQYRDGGGAALERLRQGIDVLLARRQSVERARTVFAAKTGSVLDLPAGADGFAEAQRRARSVLADHPAAARALRADREKLYPDFFVLKNKTIPGLDAELRHLKNHAGNIPSGLHALRTRFAAAAGLAPADLPFAGELLDLDPEHEEWRTAADAVLGGLATTLLVDERHRRTLRTAIDGLPSEVRVRYRGVDTGRAEPPPAAATTLAGRLVVRPGPFAGWLREHVDRQFGYECVETADRLGDDGAPRVTRTGQTQRGQGGAHGGNTVRRIGFSNDRRQAELTDEIAALQATVAGYERRIAGFETEERALTDRRDAWAIVAEARWADLDLAAVEAEIAERERARAELTAGSTALEVLDHQRTTLKVACEEAGRAAMRQEIAAETHAGRVESLSGEVARTRLRLVDLEGDEAIRLDDAQAEDLDHRLGRLDDWDGSLGGFDAARNTLRSALGHSLDGAQRDLLSAADRLTAAFTRFHLQWPDPNRGTGLPSYEDYLRILTDLRGHGLTAQRQTWSRKVIEYSGDRLSVLNNSYGRARDEINERLRPISRILRRIPFGHGDTTLDIKVDHRRSDLVGTFQAQLRTLAAGAMNPVVDDAAIEVRFEAIRAAVARIRRGAPDRDALLDVRRHLRVTAQELDAEGRPISAYDHIGDKSGGEAQMITAFICGAALRYQLDDSDRDRPRFAPVVLDEAFIKADGRYTARAVEAWRQLGFQLVVGAPEDKFNALEPAMGLVIGITKNHDEHSFAVPAPRKGS